MNNVYTQKVQNGTLLGHAWDALGEKKKKLLRMESVMLGYAWEALMVTNYVHVRTTHGKRL